MKRALLFIHNNTILKFFINGILAAVIHLGILYYLTDFLGVWYVGSTMIAYAIAFLFSFSLQKFWTFQESGFDKIRWQAPIYFIVGAINLGLNGVGIYLVVEKLHIWYILAQIIVSGLIAIESFVIYRYFIFKKELPD